MATSLSLVGAVWAILSLCATLIACIGYIMPYWLSGGPSHDGSSGGSVVMTQTTFGTFRRCVYGIATVNSATAAAEDVQGQYVSDCGRYRSFWDIPSDWWRASTVLVGCGCCLGVIVGSAGLLCCCISDAMSRRLGITACILQLIAGACIAAGCILYPLGWNSNEVIQACSALAHTYSSGTCSVGWAYWATVSAGTIMIVCSWLACYAGKRKGGYQRPPGRD